MPSVTARSLGVIMWCLPLVLQPSTTLASEPQAKASSEQQTKNPNAPPAFNESAQPPGAQARDGSPGKKPLASPSVAVSRKEEAWHTLETACTGDKATDRANATRVLGLIRNDVKATKLAEKALSDPKPEVRAAAAAALGNFQKYIDKTEHGALPPFGVALLCGAADTRGLLRGADQFLVKTPFLEGILDNLLILLHFEIRNFWRISLSLLYNFMAILQSDPIGRRRAEVTRLSR